MIVNSPAAVGDRAGDRPIAQARAIRKIQIRLLPFLFLLYVVSYIDRINIGFAALTMNRELGITPEQFGFAAGVFFLGYFLFEVPSNLLLHRIGARLWFARILLTWGVLATLSGFVQNAQQLYVVRFLLGLAEAGYFPGIALYLTYWFPARDRAHSMALILTGIPVASILGAPLSGLILDHVHWLAVSSWRWLLILQGLPAVVCGLVTYWLLPDRPSDVDFLTDEEKESILVELRSEERRKLEQQKYSVLQTLTNAQVWRLAAVHFGMCFGLYGVSFWAPQVIKSLSNNYSNTTVGVLVMIPPLVGLTGMVLVSRSSDRTMERRYHAGISAVVGAVSLISTAISQSPAALVAILSVQAVGHYGYFGPFWAMPSQFLAGYAAAAGIGLINSVASLAGFAGPYIIGLMHGRTDSLNSGLALAGIPMLFAALLLLLPPARTRP